ncbi:ADP-ribose 1''-phosphate phosphatase [Savitreella phatthalungensis]
MAVVKHVKGDLFSAPRGSILLHACNCQGVWGGGIAAAFKKRYPNAYTIYRDHCKETPKNKLLGSTLLIPLDAQGNVISKGISNGKSTRSDEGAGGNADADVVVGCLFTSGGGGSSGCDGVDEILDATQKALAHLKDQMGSSGADDITMGKRDVAACKFNSGIFNVPWERTEQVIEGSGVQMTVYSG